MSSQQRKGSLNPTTTRNRKQSSTSIKANVKRSQSLHNSTGRPIKAKNAEPCGQDKVSGRRLSNNDHHYNRTSQPLAIDGEFVHPESLNTTSHRMYYRFMQPHYESGSSGYDEVSSSNSSGNGEIKTSVGPYGTGYDSYYPYEPPTTCDDSVFHECNTTTASTVTQHYPSTTSRVPRASYGSSSSNHSYFNHLDPSSYFFFDSYGDDDDDDVVNVDDDPYSSSTRNSPKTSWPTTDRPLWPRAHRNSSKRNKVFKSTRAEYRELIAKSEPTKVKLTYRFYIVPDHPECFPPLTLEPSNKRIHRIMVLGQEMCGKSSLIETFRSNKKIRFDPSNVEQLQDVNSFLIHFYEVNQEEVDDQLEWPVNDYQPNVYLLVFNVNNRYRMITELPVLTSVFVVVLQGILQRYQEKVPRYSTMGRCGDQGGHRGGQQNGLGTKSRGFGER